MVLVVSKRRHKFGSGLPMNLSFRNTWRMPALGHLRSVTLSSNYRFWTGTLKMYLLVAAAMATCNLFKWIFSA